MRVLFVASEAFPLAKTGGLADVLRALPIALRQRGVDAGLVLPGYNWAIAKLKNPRIEARISNTLGIGDAILIGGILPGSEVPVWLVHAPSLYSRPGGLYQDEESRDWDDNPRRFSYLARVAAAIAMGELTDWKADIVHANDWHAGLVPFFLAISGRPRPASVFTIHNIAFQGNFPRHALSQTEIPEPFFCSDGVEFYGQISFLKAALRYSDKITTVSPQYREEVFTSEFGCGFEGLLKSRREDFSGILNGIETVSWDPQNDPALPQPFSIQDISGKKICKLDLQRSLGLEVSPDAPLLGFSSRLTYQKMADVLMNAARDIVAEEAQLVVVGDGDKTFEAGFSQLQDRYRGRIAYKPYSEEMAHRLHAGADIVLAPARFEPCGLTQLYALRYGSIPVVRRTGGLADTVKDADVANLANGTATGFVFDEPSQLALMGAVRRALTLFREPLTWRRLQLTGMNCDFSWEASARKYIALYQELSGLTQLEDNSSTVTDVQRAWQREIRSALG